MRNQMFIDCDGVLADFDRHFEDNFGMAPNLYEDRFGSETFWALIEGHKDFFGTAPQMADAFLLMNWAQHFRPIILTGCPRGDWSVPQKLRWRNRHFPGVPMVTCLSRDKRDYCQPGDILIDDRMHYADLWTGAGGIFVHHTTAASTIKQVGRL